MSWVGPIATWLCCCFVNLASPWKSHSNLALVGGTSYMEVLNLKPKHLNDVCSANQTQIFSLQFRSKAAGKLEGKWSVWMDVDVDLRRCVKINYGIANILYAGL